MDIKYWILWILECSEVNYVNSLYSGSEYLTLIVVLFIL